MHEGNNDNELRKQLLLSKKRELEVLVEEEAKLGADIKKSQKEIESLIKVVEDVEDLLNETTTAVTDYTDLETHMKEASVRFDAVMSAGEGDEALAQNVPDLYLDPVTLSFVEPDYSRCAKVSNMDG